ncbi:hypothetical protein [Parathalassolituus penaei]|uniref:Uncharacterized protein n=1 Tax=Parathalassolituus penaei TaxID=2997323 RepID=A0A9X3IU06_9GAMM|nr:hypothetical protein [Parathalassolituus penaei]MCY0967416.1 hypothetical protein [Parathalassolituus penaei]
MTRFLLYTGFLLTIGLFASGVEVQPEFGMFDPQLVLQPDSASTILDIIPALLASLLLAPALLLFALLLVVPLPTPPAQPVFSPSETVQRRGPPRFPL